MSREVRNRNGDPARMVTATEAKNEFGRVLERVIGGELCVVTRHDVPKAVIISVDEFSALTETSSRRLNALAAQFDELLAGMQTQESRTAMKAAFGASSRQLGKAALRDVKGD